MDLRQLSGAVAVARYSNFTRAAASLHIAQPALSAQIRNLEHEVGIPLFERTTRRVVVTPAGLAFIAHADRILAEVDAASREMAEYAGGVLGRVRIGAWYTVNPQLPALLAGFVKTHPNVEITIREENSDVMLDMVRAGELDVALPIMCKGLDLTDIDHLVYLEEPFLLAVAPNSPLASRASVAVEELFDTPMITLKPGSAIRYLIEQAFLAAGGYHHHIGLNTWESLGGPPPPPRSTGLYHLAIAYPTRAHLADALRRVLKAHIALDGASDHGVSEALYLRDPDDNGVELYWDRPSELWPRNAAGELAMYSRPLDLRGLLAEAPDVAATGPKDL